MLLARHATQEKNHVIIELVRSMKLAEFVARAQEMLLTHGDADMDMEIYDEETGEKFYGALPTIVWDEESKIVIITGEAL